ncbi:MAG TPA: hypothetical protein VH092_06755 [Urbifossiella sp.]|jgi:hypothetical protein|nr:hypothetical protein [Urbifossiella sp.]
MTTTATSHRDQLRSQWVEHAEAVFDRLFPADQTEPLPTLDRLERRTVQLSQDLAAWLLQQRAQDEAQARPAEPALCPRCRPPARAVGAADAPLPRRTVITRAGPIELARQKWRCGACRVTFFPPR